MTGKKNIQQRQDIAKTKRVELSAHTKMGPMDSVVSVKELIRTAESWGWDAIAITDHGGVQAFPDAMNTVIRDRLNIKIIYGMEGNLTGDDYKQPHANHVTILVQDMHGKNNLYRLVSKSHLYFTYGQEPRIPRRILEEHRHGLLLGSSGADGELIRAIATRQYDDEELITVARFYDYLEIQPIGNYVSLLRSDEFPNINTKEDLRDINRKVVELGKKLNQLVVATGDIRFLDPEDAICWEVIMANRESEESEGNEIEAQSSRFLHTTEEMLREFDYLGEEVAFETVVKNSNCIALMVQRVQPLLGEDIMFDPTLPDADEEIKTMAYKRAYELYGDNLPDIVQERLEQELTPILKHGFSSLFLIAHELVKESNDGGYPAFARGSVGSSFVATMTGITEVNPLPPHWRCPKCHYSEFITDGSYNSGFDLPDKTCPDCGELLAKDGHDIPFAVFLGYDGEKMPDIDINVADVYRPEICKHVEWLFGKDKVYGAGNIHTLKRWEALRYVKKHFEKKGETPSDSLVKHIVNGCEGVKKSTEAHPDGLMIVPKDMDIHFFTPVQHPNGQNESDAVITHFDYHAISSRIVKIDILSHDVPTRIKLLEDYTHCDHRTIPFGDPKTFSLFRSTEVLGVSPKDLGATTGTLGVPEFQSPFARRILAETKPTCFSDLVKISGFCHGTEIWKGNMQDALREGICTLHDAISMRDDIMMYLIHKGIEPLLAFKTMENTRKGKGLKPDVVEQLKAGGVPEWYIEACQKVKYLFPRAHVVSYVMMAYRIAYYKVHYPAAFYAAYFSVHAEAFDADVVMAGKEAVKTRISELKAEYPDLEEDRWKLTWERYEALEPVRVKVFALQVALEMLLRGYKIVFDDLYNGISPLNPSFSVLRGFEVCRNAER